MWPRDWSSYLCSSDLSHEFYGQTLGLAVYREFGPPDHPSAVYFMGNGLLEVSGHATSSEATGASLMSLWLQEIGRASCREREERETVVMSSTQPQTAD